MKLSISPIAVVWLTSLLSPASGQFIFHADCNVCDRLCPWYDLVCFSSRSFCRGYRNLSTRYINDVEVECSSNEAFDEEFDLKVQEAVSLLVDRNIATQSFVNGIDVKSCPTDVEALTVTGDRVWIREPDEQTEVFAKLLAHEYKHAEQWNRWTDSYMKCEIAEAVVEIGLNAVLLNITLNINETGIVEPEAYAFEYSVENCIFENFDCPASPPLA